MPVTDRQTDKYTGNQWKEQQAQASEQFLNGTSAQNRPFQCHYMVLNRLKRIHRVMGLCMPVTDRQTDRQTDRHTGNQWNNGLERVQKVTELVSPVTDRQTHTHRLRESRQSQSCAHL